MRLAKILEDDGGDRYLQQWSDVDRLRIGTSTSRTSPISVGMDSLLSPTDGIVSIEGLAEFDACRPRFLDNPVG